MLSRRVCGFLFATAAPPVHARPSARTGGRRGGRLPRAPRGQGRDGASGRIVRTPAATRTATPAGQALRPEPRDQVGGGIRGDPPALVWPAGSVGTVGGMAQPM
jgi:hypothetical protein